MSGNRRIEHSVRSSFFWLVRTSFITLVCAPYACFAWSIAEQWEIRYGLLEASKTLAHIAIYESLAQRKASVWATQTRECGKDPELTVCLTITFSAHDNQASVKNDLGSAFLNPCSLLSQKDALQRLVSAAQTSAKEIALGHQLKLAKISFGCVKELSEADKEEYLTKQEIRNATYVLIKDKRPPQETVQFKLGAKQ